MLLITDTTISGKGYRPRRLTPAERAALLSAIAKLDVRYFRAHPFKGTCPTAYDAQESVYSFRGFPRPGPAARTAWGTSRPCGSSSGCSEA